MHKNNTFIGPLLTDLYQLTMTYAYWKAGRHEVPASFDLFFRRCPFKGEFAVFAGLSEVISLLENFHFQGERLEAVKQVVPNCEPAFYEWLASVDVSGIKVEAVLEGNIVFPKVPLITVTGPLAVGQLLETPLLNLVNFATLMATNAARFRLAVGPEKNLLEFGLRRAQGPDGAMSAAKYAYIGGFDGTSNVLASVLHNIPCKGTHAHAFVQSFTGVDDLSSHVLYDGLGNQHDVVQAAQNWLKQLAIDGIIATQYTNQGEMAAFVSYAQAFPQGFLALVDTYDTLKSGVPNFLAVALAIAELGYNPIGIRLDSGDLSYLSKESRQMFKAVQKRYGDRFNFDFSRLTIVASNDINEAVLWQLKLEGHEVDSFGIGTHLVTCQAQPALGGVYKLVEIGGKPRVKRSEESGKITIPGCKRIYRLLDDDSTPLADLMTLPNEETPRVGEAVHCWHPFDSFKRTSFTPYAVEPLQLTVWPQRAETVSIRTLGEARECAKLQLSRMREDHLRPTNPTPYKVSVSPSLYRELHRLLEQETGDSFE